MSREATQGTGDQERLAAQFLYGEHRHQRKADVRGYESFPYGCSEDA